MPGQRQRIDGAGETLEPVVADAVARAGFDLELLHVQQAGRRQLVKVVVDSRRPRDSGIGLDQVADVSRAVSDALDARTTACSRGSYTLEVTSPGLDRPLTKPRHWRRARLRKVAVRQGEDSYTARVGDAGERGRELLVGERRQTRAVRGHRARRHRGRVPRGRRPPRSPCWRQEEGSR